jgi:hypothetical protein
VYWRPGTSFTGLPVPLMRAARFPVRASHHR